MKKYFKELILFLTVLLSFIMISCSAEPKSSSNDNDFEGTWRGSTLFDGVSYDYTLKVGANNIDANVTIDFVDHNSFSYQNYSIDNDVVSAYFQGEKCRIGKLSGESFKFNCYEDISIPPCTLYKN